MVAGSGAVTASVRRRAVALVPLRPRRDGGDHTVALTRELVWALVLRNLRLQSRRHALGVFWLPVGPLVQFAVLTAVFTRVVPVGVAHYPTFLLTGLLAWRWFSDAAREGCNSFTGSPDLVLKPRFPVAALPAVAVASAAMPVVLAMPVLAGVVVLDTGRLPLSLFALPVIAAIQALLMIGPVSILAAWHSQLRDVGRAVTAALVPLFYATPVFYSPDHLPDGMAPIAAWHPLSALLVAYRTALVDGQWPAAGPLVALAVVGFSGLVLGGAIVRRSLPAVREAL